MVRLPRMPRAPTRQAQAMGLLGIFVWVFLALALFHNHPIIATRAAAERYRPGSTHHDVLLPATDPEPACKICAFGNAPPTTAPLPDFTVEWPTKAVALRSTHAAATATPDSPALPRAPPAPRA